MRIVRGLALSLAVCCALLACAGAGGPDRLYRDLGAQPGVEALVDRFIAAMLRDPRVAGRFADTNMKHFRQMVIEQFCHLSGGPCEYTGDNMIQAHEGMNLTHGDFNAVVEDLQDAMDEQRLSTPTQNRLLALLAPMQADVVHK